MPVSRFVQIHFLTSFSAVLLNRDDSGSAKRLPYGGAMRTRISSQCLKRHWRITNGIHALSEIEGVEDAVRSRDIVTKTIRGALEDDFQPEILDAIEPEFQKAVYGKDAAKGKANRQPLLLGAPEIRFLTDKFSEIAKTAKSAAEAKKAAETFCKDKDFQATMKQWRQDHVMPGGLTSALFGRMVTSDPDANIDAPVHVAHAFTVHAEESENDYFSVVDDLAGADDTGADHIGETELTSGLFYGYVVLDVPGLVSNLTGCKACDWENADKSLAGEVASRLVHLIAETSPGAKLGSTAPYSYASTILVEAGDRQPRSLAEAFRDPSAPETGSAETRLAEKLSSFDENYRTEEARRFMSLRNDAAFPRAERAALPDLASWVRDVITKGQA